MRAGWIMMLTLMLGGCTYTSEERAKAYRDDAFQQARIGHYANARDSFQAALRQQPNDVGLLYNVGYCSDRIGDNQTAGYYYNQCLRWEPNNPTYRHALAALLLRDGRRNDAIFVVQDWLAHQPQLAEAYVEDAWLWHELGDSRNAQARLQNALEIDPNCVRALVGLGMLYEEMNMPDRALLLYEQSLRIDPKQPDIAQRAAALRAHQQPAP